MAEPTIPWCRVYILNRMAREFGEDAAQLERKYADETTRAIYRAYAGRSEQLARHLTGAKAA